MAGGIWKDKQFYKDNSSCLCVRASLVHLRVWLFSYQEALITDFFFFLSDFFFQFVSSYTAILMKWCCLFNYNSLGDGVAGYVFMKWNILIPLFIFLFIKLLKWLIIVLISFAHLRYENMVWITALSFGIT